MELGILGSGGGFGLVSAENETAMQKRDAGSEGTIQGGSGFCDDTCGPSKHAKTDADFSLYPTALLLGTRGNSISHNTAAAHTKNAGYLCRGLNASADMHLLRGIRGPFTATQWLELEQQALIYKYITANVPIPAHLLVPVMKVFESAGLYGLDGGSFIPTPWGWGPFHLGYSNSNDLEPGRCRRTDGKKWRCSKDAVPNQKYCERHMNRGRHRSRKHVEGQGNGHSVSGATKPVTAKPLPRSVVASSSAQSVLPGSSSSKSFDIDHHNHHHVNNLQRSASNPNMGASRSGENSGHALPDATEFSFLSQGINPKRNGGSFSLLSEESAPTGFGVLSSGSRRSHDLKHQKEAELQHSLCTLIEEPPRNRSSADQLSNGCPRLEPQSNSTQLSMSVLTGPADFTSSTSSPTKENLVWSPLGLPQELEMSLGVGIERIRKTQGKWTSVSWETSVGGPLGEALNSSSFRNRIGESRKTSAIHLLEKGCDENESCQFNSSSPAGVLQKSAMKSLSYSSSGGNSRTDNGKTMESAGSLCTDLLS